MEDQKKDTVSQSSVEAEYRVMANATSEVVQIHNLLQPFGLTIPATHIHCDNQATLHIVNNPVFHEHTKHIKVYCHFVCERILKGVISPVTHLLMNNWLTSPPKLWDIRQFHYLLSKLGVANLHAPT